MRTLRFIVDGLIMKKDPDCDFDGLIPGTEGYLKAEFIFSPEWDKCNKVAAFYSCSVIDGVKKECEPQILKDGKTCIIPSDALRNRKFKVKIFGKGENLKLVTTEVGITQNGG